MNYLDILQDREIVAVLSQIDILKQAEPHQYGMLHTLATIGYAKQLAKCFELTELETELLLIASALHNLGHLNGKSLHAQTGAEMAKSYLKKHNFDVKQINTICGAIASYMGRKNDNFYDNVSACLILADKMDFGTTRVKAHFEPLSIEDKVCKKISYVEVVRKDNVVQLMLGGKNVNWNAFVQTTVYSKLYKCFETVCRKHNLKFVVKVKKVV
ncbi:MAG: HD domain-containing protein [Clostridia bacterium]|nr:HD domain-containing protein [Clostridia bacterium]